MMSLTPLPTAARPRTAAPRLGGDSAPLHIVANAASGSARDDLGSALAAHPALVGRRVRWHRPGRPDWMPDTARRAVAEALADGGLVVAAGGDGTINAVAQAAWAHDLPMGVLPQGTFNYFSRQHGLASDLDAGVHDLVDALHHNRWRAVQVGQINDRLFLVNASLGLYPRLLAEREAATRQFGRNPAVALFAAAWSLLRAQTGQRLILDDVGGPGPATARVRHISTLFVGNNPLQLAQVGLPEADEVAQGALAAVTLAPQPPWAMARLLWRVARARLADEDAIHSFACQALTVRAAGWRLRPHLTIAFDGERQRMRLPLHFAVGAQPLWLAAPATPPATKPSAP